MGLRSSILLQGGVWILRAGRWNHPLILTGKPNVSQNFTSEATEMACSPKERQPRWSAKTWNKQTKSSDLMVFWNTAILMLDFKSHCLFVCLFVRLFVRSFVCLFVCLFVALFGWLFLCLPGGFECWEYVYVSEIKDDDVTYFPCGWIKVDGEFMRTPK